MVDAFFRAARGGDLEGLVAVLDPDVVLRGDYGARRPPEVFRGAVAVAGQSRAIRGAEIRPVLVNGAAGAVILIGGRPFAVMGFIVRGDRIVEIDAIADPERVARIVASVSRLQVATRPGTG